ncbi:containing a SNARE domain [Chondrus crispus]|uniref:Containing a SNARE domain n=1 Tax=Chondrus crispus TaxID=2769 RepID=R7QME0_CHOCR|nr:containing a SNARE domain [Chondrus crispus]CDF39677.1 containing a SNARE domain [Chondrus crispus]|eukprot:XP_005709971.1 containing a SNARE domain [Chondrus crispus]
MSASPHVELDLGAALPGASPSESAFETRTSRLDADLTHLARSLSASQTLLSRPDAAPAALTPHMDALHALAASVRRDLAALAAQNSAAAADPASGPATVRIRVARFEALSKRFSAFLTDYEAAREAYRLVLHNDVRQGLADLDPALDSAAVDHAMTRPAGMDAVLERASPDLKWQVRDIRERNSQLVKLNADVATLHDMFTELSFLTENQQGLINDIELNVQHVKGDVKRADDEIVEAHKYQTSARKKKMIIFILLAIILIIIAVVIVIVVT